MSEDVKCRCGAIARPELIDPKTLETVCGPCYDDFPWDEWERVTGGRHTPRSEWASDWDDV